MPSVPRRTGEDYLNPTLDYILDQLPSDPSHPMYGRVLVAVMDNHHEAPGGHPVFEAARARLDPASHPKGLYVRFLVNGPQPDPTAARGHDAGTANRPGAKVRAQTRDVAALLEAAGTLGEHYMFMEDDFRLCPHAMMALNYLIDKADRLHPDWILLRTCFGLNGAVIHATDTAFLAAYYREHQARRPPDHMLVEWFAAERAQAKAYVGERPFVTFRYNLFEHIGFHSSLRASKAPKYAACYEQLEDGVLFEVEAFKPAQCRHQDIWPCPAEEEDVGHPQLPLGPLKTLVKRVGQHISR